MSRTSKNAKAQKRIGAKREAKRLRQVHKVKSRGSFTVTGKLAQSRGTNAGNMGDYKAHFEFCAPFLAQCLLNEYRGYKNQYTSKCPRQDVRKYILHRMQDQVDPRIYSQIASNVRRYEQRRAA